MGEFTIDTTGIPDLPTTKSIDDVVLEIKSRIIQNNPSLRISYDSIVRAGPRAHKLCTLTEVVSSNSGEFKHYTLDIFSIERRNTGWFFNTEKKFPLTDNYNEIRLLYEFLKHCYDGDLIDTTYYTLVPKDSLNPYANSANNRDLVEAVLENSESYKSLLEIGGVPFIKTVLQTAFQNGHSLSALSEIIEVLKEADGPERLEILDTIRNLNLSKSDLDLLSGRKQSLDIFQENLFSHSDWLEKNWQEYFERNDWIFGYGLSYKFLQIIQREAHVSQTNVTGNHDVITDFLLGDHCFTTLVELKRPDTKLFENKYNRSGSWQLSSDLTYAVSQILEQKAVWQIKSANSTQYDTDGNPINQKTYDPKTILIIGHSDQYAGLTQEQRVKAKTFELYRRNLKDIEIITFDELYDRAKFIVDGC